MAKTKSEASEFHDGVSAAIRVLRLMRKSLTDLKPPGVPVAGPTVDMRMAQALAGSMGRIRDFDRGFVTVLAELCIKQIAEDDLTGWRPYCAQSARSVEIATRRFAREAKLDATRDALYQAKRREIAAGKVIDLGDARARRAETQTR